MNVLISRFLTALDQTGVSSTQITHYHHTLDIIVRYLTTQPVPRTLAQFTEDDVRIFFEEWIPQHEAWITRHTMKQMLGTLRRFTLWARQQHLIAPAAAGVILTSLSEYRSHLLSLSSGEAL